MQNEHARNRIHKRGGSVAEWFRVLDLHLEDPGSHTFTDLYLDLLSQVQHLNCVV